MFSYNYLLLYFQISGLMDKFEKEFEDLDVQTSVMENTMGKEIIQTSTQVIHGQTSVRFYTSVVFREHYGDERATRRG